MKKLFTNDKLFFAMVLCAVIGKAAGALISILAFDYAIEAQITLLFRVACVILLYYSYKKHSKNIMKCMMGALLASQFIASTQYLASNSLTIEYICHPLFVLLSALLFINHLIINSNRHSSPKQITCNQILVVLLFLNNTILDAFWSLIIAPTTMPIVWSIMDIVGTLGMTASIVCVESRLDAYRLDREAAGWTEEAGYPEGYVHEYQKKGNK